MKLNSLNQTSLQIIPDGPEGIRQTLHIMRRLTRAAKKDYVIRRLALRLVERNGQKDWAGEVRDLHQYVRDRIRYVKDIRDVETVQTPEVTLDVKQGDCDDKSVLLASLLESIGHRTRFIAVGFRPGIFSHVYVETKIGKQWIPLETTEPVKVGWKPPNILTKMIVHN